MSVQIKITHPRPRQKDTCINFQKLGWGQYSCRISKIPEKWATLVFLIQKSSAYLLRS